MVRLLMSDIRTWYGRSFLYTLRFGKSLWLPEPFTLLYLHRLHAKTVSHPPLLVMHSSGTAIRLRCRGLSPSFVDLNSKHYPLGG